MSFEENIKKWVTIDNKIRLLNNNISDLKENKKELSENILNFVNDKDLLNSTIHISDGFIKFNKTKQTTPLTYKYIEQCLNRCLSDNSQVEYIINYIKNSRDNKYIDDIKRTYKK